MVRDAAGSTVKGDVMSIVFIVAIGIVVIVLAGKVNKATSEATITPFHFIGIGICFLLWIQAPSPMALLVGIFTFSAAAFVMFINKALAPSHKRDNLKSLIHGER